MRGADAAEVALNGRVRSTVQSGGPKLTVGSTIFELVVALPKHQIKVTTADNPISIKSGTQNKARLVLAATRKAWSARFTATGRVHCEVAVAP